MDTLVEYYSPRYELLGVTRLVSDLNLTWVYNDIGTAQFSVATSLPNFTTLIKPGNIFRIHIEGVPVPWVGVAYKRQWKTGACTLQLKSAERLLKGHLTPQGIVAGADGNATVGTIARMLFERSVLGPSWTPLRSGTFDASGYTFEQYDYADLFDAYAKLTESSGGAFWVDENLYVHFRDIRGADKSSAVVLHQDKHLVIGEITDDYENIVTNVVGLGEGNDIASRIKILRGITTEGFFNAATVDFRGVVSVVALQTNVDSYLRANSIPRVLIDATILNVNNVWSQFWLGDTVQLVTYTRGVENFRGTVLGIEVSPSSGYRVVFDVTEPATNGAISDWILG